jgi:hypothetical protein
MDLAKKEIEAGGSGSEYWAKEARALLEKSKPQTAKQLAELWASSAAAQAAELSRNPMIWAELLPPQNGLPLSEQACLEYAQSHGISASEVQTAIAEMRGPMAPVLGALTAWSAEPSDFKEVTRMRQDFELKTGQVEAIVLLNPREGEAESLKERYQAIPGGPRVEVYSP